MNANQQLPLVDGASWEFVPDVGGLIDNVALCIPPAFFDPVHQFHNQLRSAFETFIGSFHAETRLLVLVEQQNAASLRAWLANNASRTNVEIIQTPPRLRGSYSMWIQDTVHARRSECQMRLDTSSSDNQSRNAAYLAGYMDCSSDILNVHLAGGNHLVGQDFRIVGCDSLRLTAERPGIGSLELAYERLQQLDPRKLHVFGFHPGDLVIPKEPTNRGHTAISLPVHQPVFHLDQFVSLTGTYRNGLPVILIGDPVGLAGNELPKIALLKVQLTASSDRMTDAGFHVIRNAVPYSPAENGRGIQPHFYNNVIVENSVRKGHVLPVVWIPLAASGQNRFKEEYDQANVAIWSDLGFDVVGVDGWGPLAAMQGSIRCASKVVSRRPPEHNLPLQFSIAQL